MNANHPVFLLAAMGLLSPAATCAAPVDTTQWTCETCPFEKDGVSGTVDAGVNVVSDKSAKFGDFIGLHRKGALPVLGADLTWYSTPGWYGSLVGSTETGALLLQAGREGVFSAKLGYAEIPHYLADGVQSPYLGVGGSALSLPAGFPAASTSAMPLSSTLQSVDLGTTRKRFDASAMGTAGEHWSYRVAFNHETRDGLQRASGSFYNTAAQFPAPVDQTTSQVELSTTYRSPQWFGTLGYQVSLFRNHLDSLTWANPFSSAVAAAATRGQLAAAPDNQFHQVSLSGGYDFTPSIRASADISVGRLTQDEAYLAPTLNAALAPLVATLPAQSLHGRVDTINAALRLSAAPTERLRLNASWAHDVRDNRTPVYSFQSIATDMFVDGTSQSNTPYDVRQDRYKVSGNYRWPGSSLKLSAGFDQTNTERTHQFADRTYESVWWSKAGLHPAKGVALGVKLAHTERRHDGYGNNTWVLPAENPLMRRFNMADKRRDAVHAYASFDISETLSLALNADFARDDYFHSTVGLTDSKSVGYGVELSTAITDDLQLHAFGQTQTLRSRQSGIDVVAAVSWDGRTRDAFDVFGLGVKQVSGKLELGADLTVSNSRSDTIVQAGAALPSFPTAGTSRDSLKLYANYRFSDSLTLMGSFWHERLGSSDWHLDGIAPATVWNLLTLGETAQSYTVNVLRLAMRYRF